MIIVAVLFVVLGGGLAFTLRRAHKRSRQASTEYTALESMIEWGSQQLRARDRHNSFSERARARARAAKMRRRCGKIAKRLAAG